MSSPVSAPRRGRAPRAVGWGASLTSVLRTGSGGSRLPALDGFRGLFVVLVLLYHFGVTQLVGGWVGINHFFVFSGYLIARILVSERSRYGSIDMRAFYRRRAERLLPALLVLLVAVLGHTALTQTPGVRHQVGGDVLASLFFVQNWRLVARDDAYFDMLGDPSPLRHLWTLGVEEQFYLVAPWLVLVLFVLLRGRWVRVLAVSVLTLLAVGWTVVLAGGDDPSFTRLYYGTDTRAQALLAGVAFAFALGRGGDDDELGPRFSVGVTQAIGVVGALVSVSAFFLVDETSAWLFTHGGMLAFTLGAVAMGVAATDPRPMLLTRVFSFAPLVLLGQMTYGLYIYHWPIRLWLGPHLGDLPLAVQVAALLAVTVAVAAVSFRYLEVPVVMHGVRGLWRRARDELAVALVAVSAVALAAGALFTANPAPTGPLGGVAGPGGEEQQPITEVADLVAGQPQPQPGRPRRVGAFGDSVPFYLAERFPTGSFGDAEVINLGVEGCDLLDEPITILPGVDGRNRPECVDVKKTWEEKLASEDADTLLVVVSPLLAVPHEVDGQQLGLGDAEYRELITDRLDEMVERADAAGIEQVAVTNVPCRDIDEKETPAVVRLFAANHPDVVAEYKKPKRLNALLEDWAGDHEDVALLDLDDAVCGDGRDGVEIDGVPVYSDFLHFSPEATPMVWKWVLGRLAQEWPES